MWKTGNKERIDYSSVVEFIESATRFEHEIILGTDSQPFRSGTFLVTVIAVLCKNRDYHARYFYREHPECPRHYSLYERIYSEVDLTLGVAGELRDEVPDANFSIHLDINHDVARGKTGKFSQSFIAMVRGYGYESVEVKPNAWCASRVADSHTKNIPAYLRTS
jgi:predicted RNase H-related nuclease YkuK (DUF458 family)